MIGTLFILFNLSLYYTLSGFYLYMFTETPPLIWGIPILIAVSIIYMVFHHKVFQKRNEQDSKAAINPIVILICALPAVFLLFNPTIIQTLHFLPAWALTAAIFITGRVDTGQEAFKAHFSFTAKFFLILILAIFGVGQIISSFITIIMYLIIYLLSGMTLLRILRQEGQLSKSRNIVVMLGLLTAGIVFTVLNIQDILTTGLSLVYQVIAWIIVGASMAIIFVLSLIAGLFNFGRIDYENGFTIGDPSYADVSDVDELAALAGEFTAQIPSWLPIAVMLTILAAIALMLIRKLIDKKGKKTKRSGGIIKEEEYILAKSEYKKKNKRKTFRPSDPRQAIRRYYRKFIKEGITRGAQKPLSSDTTEKINKKYSSFFPKNEANELRELYIAARYQENSKITKPAAEKATKLWRKLKTAE